MDDKSTILDEIIQQVSLALFQKWSNEVPQENRTEDAMKDLSKNASNTTFFVVQMFMDRFNDEASRLKD